MTAGLPDWLDGYASQLYDWQASRTEGRTAYTRRIGIVEGLFDTDGTDFEGRADLNVDLHVELRTSLDERATREHITLAWSILRQQHPLLSAMAVTRNHVDSLSDKQGERAFVFVQATDADELLSWGAEHIDFLADEYPQVDPRDFYQHLMNASRVIDPGKALARALVLPFKHSNEEPFIVNLMMVIAHQISDGLTVFRWASSFIDLLNMSATELKARAAMLCATPALERLPPPQEALYHPIKGSIARQRWFWAISRILRHTKRTNPPAFQNPLRRAGPPVAPAAFPPKYSKVLSYDRVPPLNNYAIQPTLGKQATQRLMGLCRQAKISFGSGLFTLVGMVMMGFEEKRDPEVPWEERPPFIGSFPVNPRPFLAGKPTTGKEDSLMLAFSDGITLPFLPSTLPFEPRFRLLGKQAHRQLRQYQKRKRSPEEEVSLGTKSPNQLLPLLYLSCIQRLEDVRSPRSKKGWDLQGAYPAAMPPTLATCGVSSVGDRSAMIAPGKYDTTTSTLPASPPSGEGRALVADFRNIQSAVRARDGEFLCGAASDKENTYLMISVDACAIDLDKAAEFKHVIEHILEDQASLPPRSHL